MHMTWWSILAAIGFAGYLPGVPRELILLNLFFFYPLVRSTVQRLRQPKESTPPRPDIPVPPVAGGALLFMLRLFLAQGLAFVVPSMLKQINRQMLGDDIAAPRTPNSAADYQQQCSYRLPFDGEWYILNGGITPQTSHSWELAAQRYAYDFVQVDAQRRRWRTNGKELTDYLCYGQPILAVADGEVVNVVDGVRDAPGVGSGWLDIRTTHFPGNLVTIRHAEGEYSCAAHLIPGSIPIKVGEQVKAGQMIGRCGHSGNSTEPHLHFQFQDHSDFWLAAGLPIAFDDVSIDGETPGDHRYLSRDQRVQHIT